MESTFNFSLLPQEAAYLQGRKSLEPIDRKEHLRIQKSHLHHFLQEECHLYKSFLKILWMAW